MHGLINRSIERFIRESYGEEAWGDIVVRIGLAAGRFEGFRRYSDPLTLRLIAAGAERLAKPEAELLEDFGAWLARTEPIRRLLRFSGADFADFILTLEELPGRVRMIVPDLEMPRIHVAATAPDRFRVTTSRGLPEWRSVLAGILRAMSDDYGALALIVDEGAAISVDVSDQSFFEARDFDLGAGVAPLRAVAR